MKSQHIGRKNAPLPFDLTAKVTKPAGGVIASVVPKGPPLKLAAVLDRIMVSSPDAGAEEPGMIGGIHVGESLTRGQGYAVVDVLDVGPDAKGFSVGGRVLVVKAQVQRVNHEGNDYYYTTPVAVIGIVQ